MKSFASLFALATSLWCGSVAAETVRGGQERALTSYQYKTIQVTNKDTGKEMCWEAVEQNNYYYVYAKECVESQYQQYWYYTKRGELKNRYYGDEYCVYYDLNKKDQYDYLVLEKCHGGSNEAWNYIDYHWVSHYDGYCVDLCRNCGGTFEVKKCVKDETDQKHYVEDYWFYGW
jgi:Ricin-type beta-trefoil lectin domain